MKTYTLQTKPGEAEAVEQTFDQLQLASSPTVNVSFKLFASLVHDTRVAHELHRLVFNPHTEGFLEGTRLEAAFQVVRWGDAHDRGKSAENWFWLVGYLAGKCLRACIDGDRDKALHHTISSAAALLNWHRAIGADQTGKGLGRDQDIKPVEISRFESAPFASTWRHKKRGTLYDVIGFGHLQASGNTLDEVQVVHYRARVDGSIWSRPLAEFMDGRFEQVVDGEEAA